jgi:hypothetical protein
MSTPVPETAFVLVADSEAGSAAGLNRLGESRFQGSDRTGPVCRPGILPRQETTGSIGHYRFSDGLE